MGFSPEASMLPGVVDEILRRILENSGSKTDVAIVLDVTGSMHDDIQNVKDNLNSLLKKLEPHLVSKGLRIAFVQYQDAGSPFATNIVSDFSSDLSQLRPQIERTGFGDGGDTPEALLDGIIVSIKRLSWRRGSSRSLIVIGDAPGHAGTRDPNYTELSRDDVMSQLKATGVQVIIYPILV